MTPTATVVATEPVETPLPQVTEPADVITGTPEVMTPHERVALVRSNDLVGMKGSDCYSDWIPNRRAAL